MAEKTSKRGEKRKPRRPKKEPPFPRELPGQLNFFHLIKQNNGDPLAATVKENL